MTDRNKHEFQLILSNDWYIGYCICGWVSKSQPFPKYLTSEYHDHVWDVTAHPRQRRAREERKKDESK